MKYYKKVGDQKKVEKYQNLTLPNKLVLPPSGNLEEYSENLVANDLFMASNFMDDDDSNAGISTHQSSEQDSSSDESYREQNETTFLLEPMGETLYENASDTESGRRSYAAFKVQESQMPLQCDFCPKKYQKLVSLKKHMRIHCNERRSKQIKQQTAKQQKMYQCHMINGCRELFKTLKELKNHEKVHKKDIKCSICYEQFDNMNELNWHIICCDASKGQRSRETLRRTRSISQRSQTPGPARTEFENDSDSDSGNGRQTPAPLKNKNPSRRMPFKQTLSNSDNNSRTNSNNENAESSSEDEIENDKDEENHEEVRDENEDDTGSSSDSE